MNDEQLKLQLGKFYLSKDGNIWCCFRLDENGFYLETHSCIRISDGRIEHFHQNGRYDMDGAREHTLVEEVDLAAVEKACKPPQQQDLRSPEDEL